MRYLVLSACVLCMGAGAASRPALSPEALAQWGRAPVLFVGVLEEVQAGPVGNSMPPMYTHRLSFRVNRSLRGPLKAGQMAAVSHVARQEAEPVFPRGRECLVSAQQVRGAITAIAVVETSKELLAQVQAAVAVPAGWSIEAGKLVCPWKEPWPAESTLKAEVACARTGRPALMVPTGVTMTVEPVPPAKSIQWTNPDGDGQYRVTVTNTTDRPQRVPALLSDGKTILWEHSLLLVCQERTYLLPGRIGGLAGRKVDATELAAGQGVSTVINVLALEGPQWPQGGYRIEFQFCLGDRAEVESFYYMSRHHDALREAARKAAAHP